MSKLLLKAILKIFFTLFARVKIIGIEKILHDQPVLLACNHIGFLDGLTIPTIPEVFNHPNLIVIIAEKYQDRPFFKWAIDSIGFIFIDRFNPDVYTIRKVLRSLKQNGLMAIAPEGTRSPNAALIQAKTGAAYFASKSGAIIVPMAATGTADAEVKKRLKSLRRLDITITCGEPFTIPPLPAENRDEFLESNTDEIMCQIAAMLPPSYRGVYSDHPRLQQLLAEGEAHA
jgi:1-acyl-sn-glycerol-3-phosphate acyltransferase